MTRPLRIEYPGAVYHITSQGNGGHDIFLDDGDRFKFLDVLGEVVDRFNWLCHAYCLMPNHYHLLVETADANLVDGMHRLNGVYTQRSNRRHNRPGHIFQGRYKAILIEKEAYLLELARYVVLNPVRAEMVRACKDWRWSSYRATARIDSAAPFLTTDWILSQFDESPRKAQRAYRKFVSDGRGKTVWDNLRGQIYLGSDAFIRKHSSEASRWLPEVPLEQRLVARPSLEQIFASGEEESAIVSAYYKYGYKRKEIAHYLGVHYSTVSRRLRSYKGKA